jgi:glutamate 5-kinase
LGYTQADIFSDNDSLAALCARSFHADVCLLLTDVDGVYDRPPSEDGANRIQFFPASSLVEIGQKSARGRGGMQAKINAALSAVQPGSKTFACIVASGTDLDSIRATLHPKYYAAHSNSSSSTNNTTTKGTLFVTPGSKLEQLCLEEINGGKEQVRNTILFFSASSSLLSYTVFLICVPLLEILLNNQNFCSKWMPSHHYHLPPFLRKHVKWRSQLG